MIFRYCNYIIIVLLMLFVFLFSSPVQGGEIGINLYGLSYHYQHRGGIIDGVFRDYNEVNLGLGLNYIFKETKRSIWFADAGFFENSHYNMAYYAGVGYKFKFTENLSAGLVLFLIDTDTFDQPVAVLPLISYRIKFVSINLSWFPDLADDEFASDAVIGYLTFHLKKF